MAAPVVFALTVNQARALDAITRPGFKSFQYVRELDSLRRRDLVAFHKNKWRLTLGGLIAQELVRALSLHTDLPTQH